MSARAFKNWLQFGVWYALTFYLSSRPGDDVDLFPFQNFDKFLHFGWYFVFGLLFANALYAQSRTLRLKSRWAFVVLLLAPLFAASDEWHQSFVPRRDVEILDAVFDVLGMGLAALLFGLKKNVFEMKRKLALTELREKVNWHRAYLVTPILVLLAFAFYYSRQDLVSSKLGSAFGVERIVAVFYGVMWFAIAVFWSRYWIWELWWRSALPKTALWVLGFLAGAAVVGFQALLSSSQHGASFMLWPLFAYALGFLLYRGGYSTARRFQNRIFPDPHKGCQD